MHTYDLRHAYKLLLKLQSAAVRMYVWKEDVCHFMKIWYIYTQHVEVAYYYTQCKGNGYCNNNDKNPQHIYQDHIIIQKSKGAITVVIITYMRRLRIQNYRFKYIVFVRNYCHCHFTILSPYPSQCNNSNIVLD